MSLLSCVLPASDDAASRTRADGATRTLARHAASLEYRAIPSALVDLTKRSLLDTLGVITGASGFAPEARIIADYVKDLGGHQQSTLLGFGAKAPAPWAAFANGCLAHMLDFDDLIDDSLGGTHTGIALVPAALAVAESLRDVTGKEFIAALVAGSDIMTRISQSTGMPYWTMSEGWFATQLLGFIGAAATAGRLLRLTEEEMENAFGIAFNQLSGSRQMAVSASSDLRAMQAGFSGQGGVLAAELARRGIVGSKQVIEGRYGLFKTYVRTDEPDWDKLTGDLGVRYPLLQTHEFKIWPACSYTSAPTAAIKYLRETFRLLPDDVESITIVGGNDGTKSLCEPIDLKRRPRSSVDAKYSIPFTAAVMMVKGHVTLRDYTSEALQDSAVLEIADRVRYRSAPVQAVRSTPGSIEPSIEICTRDGRVLVREPHGVPGGPNHPVSWDVLQSKFRDCVAFSATAVAEANVQRVIEMVRDLENVSDVAELGSLMS